MFQEVEPVSQGFPWKIVALPAICVLLMARCAWTSLHEYDYMRENIGRPACNATNGMYRGTVVDVDFYKAVDMENSVLVYVVENDFRRTNAPPSNVTFRNCVAPKK